jgi:hypothetical protein
MTIWVSVIRCGLQIQMVKVRQPLRVLSPSFPVWSPNGAQLAYVSFESRKPVIYSHEVATENGVCWRTFVPMCPLLGHLMAARWSLRLSQAGVVS